MLFDNRRSGTIKYLLLMALALMLMLCFSSCRYRITEDSYANMTAEDEDGTVRETYDYIMDELEYDGSAQPIFTAGRSHQQVENPFYQEPQPFVEEEDLEPEDLDDEEDDEFGDDADDSQVSTSTVTTPVVTRPSTVTTPASNKVTVKLNANGGKCTTASILVTPGLTYGILATPTRKGHEFLGWYTAKKKGKKILSTTKVTKKSDHTIYAHWQDLKTKKYTITLNAQGGKADTKKLKMTTNSTYEDLPLPTKKNEAFLGWYTSSSGGDEVKNGSKFKGKADTTLYAHWQDALEYWSDIIDEDNSEIRKDDAVSYYYEKSSGDTEPGDDVFYDFKGKNVVTDDSMTKAEDSWILEQAPNVIIKAIDDSEDEESVRADLEARLPGYDGRIFIVSGEAADGKDKVRAFYTLWLSYQLYEEFGGVDIDKAASELGVEIS